MKPGKQIQESITPSSTSYLGQTQTPFSARKKPGLQAQLSLFAKYSWVGQTHLEVSSSRVNPGLQTHSCIGRYGVNLKSNLDEL
jgi:hypothetical protein